MPDRIKQVDNWFSLRPDETGYGFTILVSYQESNTVRDPKDATIENWCELLKELTEIAKKLGFDGIIIGIDNAEALSESTLNTILMDYRDTLFSISDIGWVVMGPPGLFLRINRQNPRLAQRLTAADGIELPPLLAEELHDLIDRRVRRYRSREDAVSPLSRDIIARLHAAARGLPRFVLKEASTILSRIIADVYEVAMSRIPEEDKTVVSNEVIKAAFRVAIEEVIYKKRVKDELALKAIASLAKANVETRHLTKSQVQFLVTAKDKVTPDDARDHDFHDTEEFRSQCLTPLAEKRFLHYESTLGTETYTFIEYARLYRELCLG